MAEKNRLLMARVLHMGIGNLGDPVQAEHRFLLHAPDITHGQTEQFVHDAIFDMSGAEGARGMLPGSFGRRMNDIGITYIGEVVGASDAGEGRDFFVWVPRPGDIPQWLYAEPADQTETCVPKGMEDGGLYRFSFTDGDVHIVQEPAVYDKAPPAFADITYIGRASGRFASRLVSGMVGYFCPCADV